MANWYIAPISDRTVNGQRVLGSVVLDNPAAYGLSGLWGSNQVIGVSPLGAPTHQWSLLRITAPDTSVLDAAPGIHKIASGPLDAGLTDAEILAADALLTACFNGLRFTKRSLPRGNTARDFVRAAGNRIMPMFDEIRHSTAAG